MTITNDVRQYREVATEQGRAALSGVRTGVLAAVGAGDVLVARAAEQGQRLASRTQGIAGTVTRPTAVRANVVSAAQSAGEQAVEAIQTLSRRGAEIVHELRKDPRVQRVILRVERGVDVVEDSLEDLMDDVAGEVDEVAADTKKATRRAKTVVADGAETTRGTVRKTAARNTNARKSTTRTAPARKAPARSTAARTTAPGGSTPPATTAVASATKATKAAAKSTDTAVSSAAKKAVADATPSESTTAKDSSTS